MAGGGLRVLCQDLGLGRGNWEVGRGKWEEGRGNSVRFGSKFWLRRGGDEGFLV